MSARALAFATLLLWASAPARTAAAKDGPTQQAQPDQQTPATAGAALEVLEVVELASDEAYLTPGIERHYEVGDQVSIGRRRYRVLAYNTKSVVIALGGRKVSKGQRATVQVRPRPNTTFAARPKPQNVAALADQWQEPVRPAETQAPQPVPLGAPRDARRNRAALVLDYTRTQPLSGPATTIDRVRLRALLHAELADSRVAFDADALLDLWRADDLALRRGSAARPLLDVRQLELSYRGDVVHAGLGRLRYPSSTLGTLDGARASATLGQAWTLGAFGGTLADPVDGSPSLDVSRFGAELVWQGLEQSAPTRASVTAQGSRFLGRLDERRITGIVESYPRFGRLGARAELNLFEHDNPWNAPALELTDLALDASVKLSALRLSGFINARRPERSYWLAASLPPGYFCVAQPVVGASGPEPCLGAAQRLSGTFSAAWEAERWTLDAGTTLLSTRLATAEQGTVFLGYRLRELWDIGRLELGGSASRGSLLESVALNVGLGVALLRDTADVGVYYRPSVLRYVADSAELVEHGAGARLWWAATSTLDLSASADVLHGQDASVLWLQTTLAWRPRF
ncbi:MAG TPA: hypothetical protein VJU61_15610 [Polyangiaceae bacterium]|nr:hypothetical protein [Polyangiaceae bacterium]